MVDHHPGKHSAPADGMGKRTAPSASKGENPGKALKKPPAVTVKHKGKKGKLGGPYDSIKV